MAQKESEGLIDKEEKGSNISLYGNAAFAALYGIDWAFAEDKANICTSGKIAMGAGALGMGAHLYVKFTAEKELDKMRKEYEKKAVNDSSYEAQLEAFKYLKKEQELINKLATTRRNTYYVQAAGYAAAAGVAAYEGFSSNPNCGGTFSNPWIIFGTSLAASGYSVKLGLDAQKQADESEENAKKIAEVIKQFEDTMIGFCPDGRDSLTDAHCYCYLADGSENPARTNSETCQNLWNERNQNLYVAATDYTFRGEAVEPLGCVALDGTFDEECKCKYFKGTDGQNSCYNAAFSNNLGDTGQNFSLGEVQKDMNTLGGQGGLQTGNGLSGSDLRNLAIKNQKSLDDVLKKVNLDRKKHNQPPFSKDPKFLEDFVAKFAKKAADKGRNSNLGPFIQGQRPSSKNLSNAIQKIQDQKSAAPEISTSGGGKNLANTGGRNSQKAGSIKSQHLNFNDFKDKKYNYGNNDIHSDKNNSLWKIISNRYHLSGLKKLFED